MFPWGDPCLSSSCPSYLHTQLHFTREPISNRFPHRCYQQILPSHNSPPTGTSLLPLKRYKSPASPQNPPSFFLGIHQYNPYNGSKNSVMVAVTETFPTPRNKSRRHITPIVSNQFS